MSKTHNLRDQNKKSMQVKLKINLREEKYNLVRDFLYVEKLSLHSCSY
jgi:hypothetical protein